MLQTIVILIGEDWCEVNFTRNLIHVVQLNVRLLEELKLSLDINKKVISLDNGEVKVLKLLPLAQKSICCNGILFADRPSAILFNRSVRV